MPRPHHVIITNPAPATAASTTNPSIPLDNTANPSSVQTGVVTFDSSAPEHLIGFTNADAIYTFTSRGGGLQSVKLTKYPDSTSLRWKKEVATNAVATLNAHAPVPVLAILGDPSLVGDGNFSLKQTADGVRAEKVLPDGLRLVKEFHVSFQLSGERGGAAGQHLGQAGGAARAGMGRRHRDADGSGRQRAVSRRDVV